MGLFGSRPASAVPALLRCDGHYELSGTEGDRTAAAAFVTWCGYLRFEGNGGFVCKISDVHEKQLRGPAWDVIDEVSVRLTLPPSVLPTLPKSLVVCEGPVEDTIDVSADGITGVARFNFVPEEDHHRT